jgi:formate-dependent nitrite reductase membrane component NrfD
MESTLNFAWALLAAGMLILWLRHARNSAASRGTQFAALAMLILILFPVISVTDDLQALQNPAETESYLRRDHAAVSPHSIFPTMAALPPSVFSGIFSGFLSLVAPSLYPAPVVDNPAMAAIQNRPPPVA